LIGIYHDNFIDFLKTHLGEPVSIKSKNIICRCPWCEMDKNIKHFHLYISTEIPIFHCFKPNCPGLSGNIKKLIKKLSGRDYSDKFIDVEKIKTIKSENQKIEIKKNFKIPQLNYDNYQNKLLYLKGRLSFDNTFNIKNLKGLVLDFGKFIDENNIELSENIKKIKNFLTENFVGFLTENHSILFMRNIDHKSSFPHFKLYLQKVLTLDYYKINGLNPNSNKIILAEGIYDIFSEYIFNFLNLRSDIRLYACSLSATSYKELIKSIVFNEEIFNLEIYILSDNDVKIQYYKNLKKICSHAIEKMTIYYNEFGKDFNSFPVKPHKIII